MSSSSKPDVMATYLDDAEEWRTKEYFDIRYELRPNCNEVNEMI